MSEQAWEDMRAYNIRLEERAREAEQERDHYRFHFDQQEQRAEKAERALAETREVLRRIAEGDPPDGYETWTSGKSWRVVLARAALRASEDTSDES